MIREARSMYFGFVLGPSQKMQILSNTAWLDWFRNDPYVIHIFHFLWNYLIWYGSNTLWNDITCHVLNMTCAIDIDYLSIWLSTIMVNATTASLTWGQNFICSDNYWVVHQGNHVLYCVFAFELGQDMTVPMQDGQSILCRLRVKVAQRNNLIRQQKEQRTTNQAQIELPCHL